MYYKRLYNNNKDDIQKYNFGENQNDKKALH